MRTDQDQILEVRSKRKCKLVLTFQQNTGICTLLEYYIIWIVINFGILECVNDDFNRVGKQVGCLDESE
jgi:hypothetical protein